MLIIPIGVADNIISVSCDPATQREKEISKFSNCLSIYVVDQGDELCLSKLSSYKYILVFCEFKFHCLSLSDHGRIYYPGGALLGTEFTTATHYLSKADLKTFRS